MAGDPTKIPVPAGMPADAPRDNPFWQVVLGLRPRCPTEVLLDWHYVAFDAATSQLEVRYTLDERFTNPIGTVHGGIIATMLDNVIGPVIVAHLPVGQFAPTLELKTSYLRAAQPGTFTAQGQLIRLGRTVAFAEARLFDSDGNLCATGSATAAITPLSSDGSQADGKARNRSHA